MIVTMDYSFFCNFVLSSYLSVHLKHEGRENSLYFVLQNLVENATPFKFQKITFALVADVVAPPYRS